MVLLDLWSGFRRPASDRAHGRELILLAEDEPSLRSLVTTILRDLGYRVIAAANGERGRTRARSGSNPKTSRLSYSASCSRALTLGRPTNSCAALAPT
jgi:hypothetical protein